MRVTGLLFTLAACSGLYGGPSASLTGTAGGQVFVDIAGPAPLTSATEFHRLFGDVRGGEATLKFGGTMKVLTSPGWFNFSFTEATIECTQGICGDVSLDMLWTVPLDRPMGGPGVKFSGSVDGHFGNGHWLRMAAEAFNCMCNSIATVVLPGTGSGSGSNDPFVPVLPLPGLLPMFPVPSASVDVFRYLAGPVEPPETFGVDSNSTSSLLLQFNEAITVKARMTIFNMNEGDKITLPDSLVFSISNPSSAVPEPATAAVVGAVVGLLYWTRRRG